MLESERKTLGNFLLFLIPFIVVNLIIFDLTSYRRFITNALVCINIYVPLLISSLIGLYYTMKYLIESYPINRTYARWTIATLLILEFIMIPIMLFNHPSSDPASAAAYAVLFSDLITYAIPGTLIALYLTRDVSVNAEEQRSFRNPTWLLSAITTGIVWGLIVAGLLYVVVEYWFITQFITINLYILFSMIVVSIIYHLWEIDREVSG